MERQSIPREPATVTPFQPAFVPDLCEWWNPHLVWRGLEGALREFWGEAAYSLRVLSRASTQDYRPRVPWQWKHPHFYRHGGLCVLLGVWYENIQRSDGLSAILKILTWARIQYLHLEQTACEKSGPKFEFLGSEVEICGLVQFWEEYGCVCSSEKRVARCESSCFDGLLWDIERAGD